MSHIGVSVELTPAEARALIRCKIHLTPRPAWWMQDDEWDAACSGREQLETALIAAGEAVR